MRSKVAIGFTKGFTLGLSLARAPKVSRREFWGARANLRFSGFLSRFFHGYLRIVSTLPFIPLPPYPSYLPAPLAYTRER